MPRLAAAIAALLVVIPTAVATAVPPPGPAADGPPPLTAPFVTPRLGSPGATKTSVIHCKAVPGFTGGIIIFNNGHPDGLGSCVLA